MRRYCFYALLVPIAAFNFNCASIKERPKYKFSDGVYKVRHGKEKEKSYVTINENELRIYSRNEARVIDTAHFNEVDLSGAELNGTPANYTFSKTTFDVDLLNLPAKFRAKQDDFPPQLDAGLFNGAVYFGRRIDAYTFKRASNRVGTAHAVLNHYGFSMGLFGGLGTTPMSEYVTNHQVDIEYSGIIVPVGITSLFAVNDLTFGLALGVDHLLDKNKKLWIYQGKPWLGLAIGFNLN